MDRIDLVEKFGYDFEGSVHEPVVAVVEDIHSAIRAEQQNAVLVPDTTVIEQEKLAIRKMGVLGRDDYVPAIIWERVRLVVFLAKSANCSSNVANCRELYSCS